MASKWLKLFVCLLVALQVSAKEKSSRRSRNDNSSDIAITFVQHSSSAQREKISAKEREEEEMTSRFKRRSKLSNLMPEFSSPIGNVTAVLGRDVRLICTVEHLGQYQGFYQCQVNTNPMRSTSGYLEVVVPPTIQEAQSTQVAEIVEHSNVSIQCKATGHPRPTIVWRRDDGLPIRLKGNFDELTFQEKESTSLSSLRNLEEDREQTSGHTTVTQIVDIKSDRLSLYDVDRSMAAIYTCLASNGIPAQATKRIPLFVKFPPKATIQNKYISVSLGDQLDVDCLIEAFPKANSYWTRRSSSSLIEDPHEWAPLGNRRAISFRKNQVATGRATLQSSSVISKSNNGTNGDIEQQFPVDKQQANLYSSQTQFVAHSHNRIQVRRQVVERQIYKSITTNTKDASDSSLMSSSGSNKMSLSSSNLEESRGESRAYVTVRQTTINSYTYKLRLTIAKMHPDDYGEYSCVATNPMGSSEMSVQITRADKLNDANKNQLQSVEESDYQRDSLEMNSQLQSSTFPRRGSMGNRVVYDENYLQTIKSRQNNLATNNRVQQRLKAKQSIDRNSADSNFTGFHRMISLVLVLLLAQQARNLQLI